MEAMPQNKKSGGQTMSKMNFVVALFIAGILCSQYNGIVHAQESSSGQMKMDQTNNENNNPTAMNTPNKFEFQPLPYPYDALEPYIDKLTVEIHYSKHHKAYYDNFINAIKGTEAESMDIMDIFSHIGKYPIAVRNNSGGLLGRNESSWRRSAKR